MKLNKTCANLAALFFAYKYYGISMILQIYFSIRFISKMNDDSSGGTMTIIGFYFINEKRNWAHLAEKKSQAGSKITTIQAIMKILY